MPRRRAPKDQGTRERIGKGSKENIISHRPTERRTQAKKESAKMKKIRYAEVIVYKDREKRELVGLIRFDMLNEPWLDLKDCLQNFVVAIDNLSILTPEAKDE